MPQSNGRIYTEIRDGVKYGIDPADVAYVLGEVSGDYGVLCSSNNINKWAKYKPVPLTPVGQPADWYKCPNPPNNDVTPYCCGFRVAHVNAIADIPSMYASYSNMPWVYQKPRGLQYNEAFRIADFNHYYHGCTPLVEASDLQAFPSVVEPGYIDGVSFSCNRVHTESDELQWTDFDTLKNCYFGIALCHRVGTTMVIDACATNQERAIVSSGTTNLTCNIDTSNLIEGDYEMCPFLSTVIIQQGQTPASGTFYSLPFIKEEKFMVMDFLQIVITASAEGEFDEHGTFIDWYVQYSVNVTNVSDEPYVVQGAYSMLRATGSDWDDPIEPGSEEEQSLHYFPDPVTIQAGATYSYTRGQARTTRVQGGPGYILAVFEKYHATAVPVQP